MVPSLCHHRVFCSWAEQPAAVTGHILLKNNSQQCFTRMPADLCRTSHKNWLAAVKPLWSFLAEEGSGKNGMTS